MQAQNGEDEEEEEEEKGEEEEKDSCLPRTNPYCLDSLHVIHAVPIAELRKNKQHLAGLSLL